MKITTNLVLGGIISLSMLLTGVFGGWKAHEMFKPCPEIIVTTDTVYDTITYIIHDTIPDYKVDTIFIPGDSFPYPQDIDTANIIKNYFSVMQYLWSGRDSNIVYNLETTITRNRPIDYCLEYKLLKPQTITINNIDNSVTYNRYVYGGLEVPIVSMPFRQVKIKGLYAFPKGYIGGGYQPYTNMFTIESGINIFKFKKRK